MLNPSLDFHFAFDAPQIEAIFRQHPEDFVVEECFDQALTGEGEHFWLKIRKRGENTDWIAKKLANYYSVRTMDIGYAGKKDRHAITTQWFSIYLPKQAHKIDWSAFVEMAKVDAQLLDQSSHRSKLKKGAHSSNKFKICLRSLSDTTELAPRLEKVIERGVPNYFGSQRFGRDGGNLIKAEQWVQDPRSIRNKGLRSIIISSARSYLFNTALSLRVRDGTWLEHIDGDPEIDFPSGPLWGRGLSLATSELLAFERQCLEPYQSWCSALENVGLQQERRNLVLRPQDFQWELSEDQLHISMTLSPGEYATAVLRELAKLIEPNKELGVPSTE